ncbi:ERF family protein [Ferviditalea candida]|uniref:ERF family protein n=1 Tax=Ferviditalea candida TaxID=3108399 RepID=A0ABU5ZMF2_9BACL|nr:ERF family protein [Paenibacillaceae bacterium T2]
MSEKTLVKKLVEVMKHVKYIQKTGKNTFHNYNYATEADVNEKVREVLAENNVILIPNVKSHAHREHINAKGKTEYIVTVEVEFTFIDGDSGERITFTTFGEGQDAGDKGTYKAITGAQKYALMKAFMIPTGDDPEGDLGVDERNNGNENRQDKPPASLKAKYQLGKGSLDGYEDWVEDMKSKGHNYQKMEQILQTALSKKEA